MVGSALVRLLENDPQIELIVRTHNELDLSKQDPVNKFFKQHSIDEVYLAAAKVGGIHANDIYPADFIYDNLMIQSNVINAAYQSGVVKLLLLGSSCIYPRQAVQPMHESSLMTGELEPTNEPYAIAKIAGIKLCESYSRQYSVDYRCVMPSNLYGPNDNFHPQNSHVIPAMMRRVHLAKLANESQVVIWGSGLPKREFLYVNDMASASIHIMNLPRANYQMATQARCSHINIGTGLEHSIRELAEMICDVVGFTGELAFDNSKPDGAPRKLLDVTRLQSLGWQSSIELYKGLSATYDWFLQNEAELRGVSH